MKIVFLAVLILLSMFSLYPAATVLEQVRTCDGQIPLAAINQQTITKTFDPNDFQAHSAREFCDAMVKYSTDPSPYFRRQWAWAVAAEAKENQGLLQHDFIENMNLLSGAADNPTAYVAQSLNRAQTEVGFVALMTLLCQPTTDAVLLRQRQAAIQTLMNDAALAQSVREQFAQCAARENQLLFFWNSGSAAQSLYYHTRKNTQLPFVSQDNRFAEEYPSLINLITYNGAAASLVGGALGIFIGGCLVASGVLQFHANLINSGMTPPAEDGNATALPGVAAFAHRNAAGKELAGIPSHFFWLQGLGSPRLQAVVKIIAGILVFDRIRSQVETLRDGKLFITLLHYFLLHAARGMHCMHNVYQLVKDRPEIATLPEVAPLIEYFTTVASHEGESGVFACEPVVKTPDSTVAQHNTKIKELTSYLLSYDPAEKPTAAINMGKAIRTYLLLCDNRTAVAKALFAVGHVDAYLGLAHLVSAAPDRALFCFPRYNSSTTPQLSSSDFWHPMLDPATVVTNSLTIGQEGAPLNVLISGRNTGGKSTMLKALMLNALMGQTIGIAAARECRFTPFDSHELYANVRDNLGGGTSLFMNQVQQEKRILDVIAANEQTGKLTLSMVDEFANGTDTRAGSSLAYHTAHYLSGFSKTINVIASHYPRLKFLESATDLFGTYRVNSSESKFMVTRQQPFDTEPQLSPVGDLEKEDMQEVIDILERVDYPAEIVGQVRADLGV